MTYRAIDRSSPHGLTHNSFGRLSGRVLLSLLLIGTFTACDDNSSGGNGNPVTNEPPGDGYVDGDAGPGSEAPGEEVAEENPTDEGPDEEPVGDGTEDEETTDEGAVGMPTDEPTPGGEDIGSPVVQNPDPGDGPDSDPAPVEPGSEPEGSPVPSPDDGDEVVDEQPSDNAPEESPEDPADSEFIDLFDLNLMLYVDIQMSPEDWRAVAEDGSDKYRREGAPCFPGYTWHTGTVTVNGETAEEVSIRKKGNWSASETKPALKLDFGKGDYDDREIQGERRFTLNNNVQDRSLIKQCLSYSLFADAGVHTPRCNFAQVTAQGEDLGIYTHVEAIKKPFLSRSFGNKSGNLYESEGGAAFTESRISYFEKKTNEDEEARTELEAVVEAMNADDAELWEVMNRVINLDNFINFAIMEALLGHADGFTSHQNNAYVYHNPDDGRLYFIPWGTDQTFRASHILDHSNITPASIMRGSHLTRRLWESGEFRTRYDARLREILDTVWDEESIKARAENMAAIAGTSARDLRSLFNFIDERRARVEAELAGEEDRLGRWTVLEDADAPPAECEITDDGEVVLVEPEAS